MTPEQRKIWLHQEESRLINYQHQHRGLNFLKLLLPPTTDRKVNLVGLDNHIYRGSVPRVPEDQLPPEVDKKSIDEEALYKEISEMNFPRVPEREPLGPPRRIGGSYTLAKKLILAPVQVKGAEGFEETLILGKDGNYYKGTVKYASKVELSKKLGGTKRPVAKKRLVSSTRGFVEPSLITLQGDTFVPYSRVKKSLIKLPIANVGKIVELIKNNKADRKVKISESTKAETSDITDAEESKKAEQVKLQETKQAKEPVEIEEDTDTTQSEQSEESDISKTEEESD